MACTEGKEIAAGFKPAMRHSEPLMLNKWINNQSWGSRTVHDNSSGQTRCTKPNTPTLGASQASHLVSFAFCLQSGCFF